jgi:hypothetical protein
MSLLLVPASTENLEKSITKSVDLSFARVHLGEGFLQILLRLAGNEGVRCWAMTKSKQKLFTDIETGDEVLFTEKGTGLFTHYGIVIGKTQNIDFGGELWPFVGVNPWEYIYFLANTQRVTIDKSWLVSQLGYNPSFAVPGPILVKREQYEKLGSVAALAEVPVFAHISECVPERDYSALDIPTLTKRRQGHSDFSKDVKQKYGYKCAICEIAEPEFLVAGHISAWAQDKENRLNPSNGICLCSLHDKAFEHGYISLNSDYEVLLNPRLATDSILYEQLSKYVGKQIRLPSQYEPSLELLKIHRRIHSI